MKIDSLFAVWNEEQGRIMSVHVLQGLCQKEAQRLREISAAEGKRDSFFMTTLPTALKWLAERAIKDFKEHVDNEELNNQFNKLNDAQFAISAYHEN